MRVRMIGKYTTNREKEEKRRKKREERPFPIDKEKWKENVLLINAKKRRSIMMDHEKELIVSLVLSVLAVGLLPRAVSGRGQSQSGIATASITFKISFAFIVNDTKFPAGTYTFTKVNKMNYRISDPKGEHKLWITTESTTIPEPAQTLKLYFNVYGDQYYLSKFFYQGRRLGAALSPTAAEKDLANKVPVRIMIIGK
jgi:hypothetical protein